MSDHIPRISLNSIRFKLVMGVFSVLLPLIGLLIYYNFYSINVIHNQVAESNKNMLSLYMRQIDTNLQVVDNYLTSMITTNADLQSIGLDIDEDSWSMIKSNLSIKISQDVVAYKMIDSIFIYTTLSGDFLYGYNETKGFEERENIKAYVIDTLNSNVSAYDLYSRGWFAEKINGEYYLLRLIKFDYAYIGAWVNVQKLMIPLNLINLGEGGASVLITIDGKQMASSNPIDITNVNLDGDLQDYYLTGDKNKYLVVGEKSSKGNFSLVTLIPDKEILENLPYLQRIITVIVFGSILLLPLCFFLLRKIVLIPINRILSAMKKIRDGDIEVRIKKYATSDEFQMVNDTFNNMLDQIHELKISVYEEQLSKQKAELEHLQHQVNPHFFLNSLNIIYRLAQTGKYDLIQEMAMCLLQYFRYMFRNNLSFVTLKDELEHVRNYIRIQELRFPGSLTYEITAPEFLLDTHLPPLLIQNFVENTVKYAVTLDEPVHLSVNIDYKSCQSKQMLEIVIKDTGKGFSEEVLTELRAGRRIIDKQGEHIGIWNVQRRLQLLYSGEASIKFSNGDPSGAVVEINLPIKPLVQFAAETA